MENKAGGNGKTKANTHAGRVRDGTGSRAQDANTLAIVDNPNLTARQRSLLLAYAASGNITRACQCSRVPRTTHYRWMEHKTYKAAFGQAMDAAGDMLENEAWRRAVEGVRRLKFTSRGEPVIDPETGQQYFELEYSDKLLSILLQGMRPERYARQMAALNVVGGDVVTVLDFAESISVARVNDDGR